MRKNGLWINEHQFIHFADAPAKAQKPLTEEIVTRQRSLNFFTLSNIYLPNPDPVLRKEGRNVDVYRDLLVDDRVAGNTSNRKGAILSLEWEIDRGERGKVKSKQAKVIEEWIKGLDIQRIMSEILDAMWYGYQPLENLWEQRNGLYLPKDIVGKPAEWFVYNIDNELRFRSRENPLYGEELPPRSFVVPRHNASYFFPYGLGDAAACFWPCVFKKGGWKFWISFAEKYGQAFAVGKIRRGASPAEMDDLADKLESMVQDAIAVIYDDSSVELMSDQGKGASSELFQNVITEANSAISTVIMGHASGGQSTPGKLGNDNLAQLVRKDIVDAGKKLICQTINQVIRWIGEVNWGSATAVPTFGLFEEEEVDKDQSERDDKLVGPLTAAGLKLSRSYFIRTYNLEESDLEEAPAPAPTPAVPVVPAEEPAEEEPKVDLSEPACPHCQAINLAEIDPDAVDAIASDALDAADGSALVSAIREHIALAKSLENVVLELVDVNYDLLESTAEALAQACILANLTGRGEVLDEVAGTVSFAEPLPFDEAIAFFRQKLDITSERWTDIWQGQHSRMFTVAGAMRDDMLADFRAAIDSALQNGTTYQTFLADFDAIVQRYGWSYKGSRGWRSKVIYDTNIRTAYNAGRWAQLTDPDLLKLNPYLEYHHGDSKNPRQLHLSWNGIVLPADDPWWKTHYTPNGWGCKCRVLSAGKRDLEKAGKTGPDQAPDDGTYEWVDKKTGEVHEIPKGIDPGWAYNPGEQWLNPTTGKLEDLV